MSFTAGFPPFLGFLFPNIHASRVYLQREKEFREGEVPRVFAISEGITKDPFKLDKRISAGFPLLFQGFLFLTAMLQGFPCVGVKKTEKRDR